MKLNLVLFVLLPQALCAQHAVDPAELQEALQSQRLQEWIESIAARRQISKDAVLSNIQAITYHLDPVGKDPGSAGGEHPKLDRRQVVPVPYPMVFQLEQLNDELTNARLAEYHELCRRGFEDPPGGQYTPNDGLWSFWRAFSGGCYSDKRVRISCKYPKEFGPPGWNPALTVNTRGTSLQCPTGYKCTLFRAHNFSVQRRTVNWGGCTEDEETDKQAMINNVPEFFGELDCPLKPEGLGEWAVYAHILLGNIAIDWTLFTGVAKTRLYTSHSPDFLFVKKVAWRGKDPDYQPWLKFRSEGHKATIRVYSHLEL